MSNRKKVWNTRRKESVTERKKERNRKRNGLFRVFAPEKIFLLFFVPLLDLKNPEC